MEQSLPFKVRPLRPPLKLKVKPVAKVRRAGTGATWKPRILDTARRSGISSSHVSKIFTGTRRPSVETLEKLAVACRMSVDELLRRLPPRAPTGRSAA